MPETGAAQSHCVESGTTHLPAWVRTLSADGQRFRYYVGQRSGSTFQSAFEGALGDVLRKIRAEESVEIESVVEVMSTIKAQGDAFTHSENLSALTKSTVQGVIKGADVYKIHVMRTCDGGPHFEVSLMMRRRRSRIDRSIPAPISTGDILWRSAVVPGWGQLHAGHNTRGWLLLSTAVGGLTVGILTHQLASNDFANAASSTRQSDRDHYDERAHILQTTSYVALALSAGLYIYNVIDASTLTPAVQYYASVTTKQGIHFHPTGLVVNF